MATLDCGQEGTHRLAEQDAWKLSEIDPVSDRPRSIPTFLSVPKAETGKFVDDLGAKYVSVHKAPEALLCFGNVAPTHLHEKGQELFKVGKVDTTAASRTSVSDGLDGAFSNYSKVCALLATNPSYFRNFRRVQEYLAVVEHTGSAKPTHEYINSVAPWLLDFRHLFATSDVVGNPILHQDEQREGYLQRQTADYVSQLADMLHYKALSPFGDVLELGIGYGGLSKVVQDVVPVRSYTLIDLQECLALASRFLSAFPVHKSRCIFLGSVRDERDMGTWRSNLLLAYDTCVSSYAFSELSMKYREFYWNAVFARCRNGFILDNSDCLSPLESAAHTRPFQREHLVDLLQSAGRLVSVLPGNEQGYFNEDCRIYKILWTSNNDNHAIPKDTLT